MKSKEQNYLSMPANSQGGHQKYLTMKCAEETGSCWSHLLRTCQTFEREYARCLGGGGRGCHLWVLVISELWVCRWGRPCLCGSVCLQVSKFGCVYFFLCVCPYLCACVFAAGRLSVGQGDFVPVLLCVSRRECACRYSGCVSVAVVVVRYKSEHVCQSAFVPVCACLGGHSHLCSRRWGSALVPPSVPSGPRGSQGWQVVATEEPKTPGLTGKHGGPGFGPLGPTRVAPREW
jgi:hypothetical protein